MASYSSVYSQDRPELSRGSGAERKCSCPSPGHEDRKPSCSVNVNTGKWCCHGCGESGHVVEWLRLTRGVSGPEALQEARRLGFLVTPESPHRQRPGVKESLQSRRNGHRLPQQSNPIEQAPPCVLPDQYAACYRYRTPDGTEYARVYRDPANRPGRKADPYTLRTSGPHAGTWAHRAPQDRWPYRIETLSTGASVVIVEGEKCADALAALAEGPDVLTWMGGSSAVLRTNWNGLAGREVTLWPDADEPGKKCMARLADELSRIGAKSVQAINPEQARPTGWDVADAITTDGWGWEELERYLGRAEEVIEEETRRLKRVALAVLVRADGIQSQPVEWVWEPYIPSGAVTLMAGAPGCGKSFLSTALAASLSRGVTPFYRHATESIRTAILSLEDDPAKTIVPRLKSCEADLREIVIFDPYHPEADPLGTLSVGEGTEGELLRVLTAGVETHGFQLVVIDTLTAFTPAKVDGHAAVSVRQMMKPLARFASDCGVGVLVVTHTRKSTSDRSTHGVQATILGSVDYVASSRSALVVQKDPKAEKETAGIVTHAKCNFGPLGPSLSFSIGVGGWKWGEEREETAEEIEAANIARSEHARRKDREERQQARRAETRARIEKEIRTYLEVNEEEEISTRELRENIEGKNDIISSVLNELAGQGRLRRRKEGKQKVLWSLAGDDEELLQTGSLIETGSLTEEKKGTGLNSINTNVYPVKNKPVPTSLPIHAREGTGLCVSTGEELEKEIGKAPPEPGHEAVPKRFRGAMTW